MTNDERARDAVEHLQRAALELIAAARVVLDVAEEMVKDPTPLIAMATATAAQTTAATARPPNQRTPERAPRVEHIIVS